VATEPTGIERFRIMERRLFILMTIGALLTAVFGLWLIVIKHGSTALWDGKVAGATIPVRTPAALLSTRAGTNFFALSAFVPRHCCLCRNGFSGINLGNMRGLFARESGTRSG
jgi:hypothetical protein